MLLTLPDAFPYFQLIEPDDIGFWITLGVPADGRHALLLGSRHTPRESLVITGTLLEIARYADPQHGVLQSSLSTVARAARTMLTPDELDALRPPVVVAPPRRPAPPSEPLIRLTHTGLLVPDHTLRITSYRGAPAPDGEAFTATLRRDTTIVGAAHNSGTGGPTTYEPRPDSTLSPADLQAYAERCRTAAGWGVDVETLLDDLVEEYCTHRDITSHASRSKVVLRLMATLGGEDDPARDCYEVQQQVANAVVLSNPAARQALVTELLAERPPRRDEWWQVWADQQWSDLTDRPASARI